MNIVGVRFRRAGEVHYVDPRDLDLNVDDKVVVETEDGLRLGRVVIAPRQVLYSEVLGPLNSVLRRATKEDLEKRGAVTPDDSPLSGTA